MWFFGPVFVKELLEIARRGRYYFARMSLGIIILMVLIIISAQAPRRFGLHETAAYGHSMFVGWLCAQFGLLTLLTPTLVGGLVAGEKEKGSLELLFTTDLRNREILWGKLGSRLLIVGLILLSAVPVLILLSLFGGIDYMQLLLGTCITISSTALIGSVGLYFSVVTGKPWIAMLRTYLFGALVWFFLPFVLGLVVQMMFPGGPGTAGAFGDWFFWTIFLSHPLLDMILVFEPRAPIPVSAPQMILSASGLWLSIASVVFALACYRLRSAANLASVPLTWRIIQQFLPRKERRSTVAGPQSTGALRLPKVSLPGSSRWRERVLEWNPLVFRNSRASIYDSGRHLATIQLLGFLMTGVLLFLYYRAEPRLAGGMFQYTFAVSTQMIGLHLILVIIAAGSISRERETGTLDLLLTTSITPTQIVLGHFHGVLTAIIPTFFLVICTLAVGSMSGAYTDPWFLIWYILVMTSQTLSIAAGALLVSVACRRVGTATALALIAPVLLWLGSVFFGKIELFWSGTLTLILLLVCAAAAALLLWRPAQRLAAVALLAATLPTLCFLILTSLTGARVGTRWQYAFSFFAWLTEVGTGGSWYGGVNGVKGSQWATNSGLEAFKGEFVLGNLLAAGVLLVLACGLFPRLIDRYDPS